MAFPLLSRFFGISIKSLSERTVIFMGKAHNEKNDTEHKSYADGRYKRSNRKRDQELTDKVAVVQDKMYSNNGFQAERIDDVELQKNGLDVILKKDEKEYHVDEKAAITAWDRDLKTFAIELYTENNKGNQGWFVNTNSITTHYAFTYLRAYDETLRDIYEAEILLVEKKKLKEYLKEKQVDLNPSTIKQKLEFFGDKKEGQITYTNPKGMKIVQSIDPHFKRENPINVLVEKEELIKMADFRMTYDMYKDKDAPKIIDINDFKDVDEKTNQHTENIAPHKSEKTEKASGDSR